MTNEYEEKIIVAKVDMDHLKWVPNINDKPIEKTVTVAVGSMCGYGYLLGSFVDLIQQFMRKNRLSYLYVKINNKDRSASKVEQELNIEEMFESQLPNIIKHNDETIVYVEFHVLADIFYQLHKKFTGEQNFVIDDIDELTHEMPSLALRMPPLELDGMVAVNGVGFNLESISDDGLPVMMMTLVDMSMRSN